MGKAKWTNLHHQIHQVIKKQSIKKPFLLAISGGLDSVACFHLLKDLGFKLELLHVHHGPSKKHLKFRDLALKFVQKLADDHKLVLHTARSSQPLASEAEMRNFRLVQWKKWRASHTVTLAHHQQDLLETRIMRLIRGTGPEGLKAMDFYQGGLFRPLLATSQKNLMDFMNENSHSWIEDPSNQDPIYFRNWLRHFWLKDLENHRPGSLNRLSESLNHLASVQVEAQVVSAISIQEFLSKSSSQQIQLLSLLLKSKGVTDFSLSQLKEVQRQLDKDQKRHSFKCAGVIWQVNAQQITLKQ